MTTRMLIDASHEEETRVVIADDEQVLEFDFVTAAKEQIKGNIYLGKITRVEPSLQAAFVEYGGGKQGFLSFSEIHPDYYQIPAEDRAKLLEEEEAEAEEEEAEEEREEEEAEERRNRRRSRGGRNRRRGRRRGNRDDENKEETAEGETSEEESVEGEESATEYAEAKTPDMDVSISSEPVETDDSEDDEAEERKEEARKVAAQLITPDDEDESDEEDDADEDDDTEELGGDDVEEVADTRKKRPSKSRRRYKINEVIKRGQIVLVQAVKEERGNKGASVTTYISLAGRYCVLMPNSLKGGGISRKIAGGEERKRLKEISAEMKESRGLNMIIRTAGIGRTKAEIKRDYEYLVKLWSQVREDTLKSSAPALIHEEGNIIKRSIRDLYNSDFEEILVEGDDAYKEAKSFMKMLMPSHAPRVKQYKDDLPIFSAFGVEDELASIYEPTAKMPSGGYIVIEPTEALISIDVNSGRSTSERNVEETALKTNLEAAKEVARQLRLRDMAGLIIVDFIDMNYGKNRRAVEKAMKDALKDDRAKIQVTRISTFGLMELSRQRMRPNIMESSAQVCPHCRGTGFIRSVETVAIQIIRLIEREATYGEYKAMKVTANRDVGLHLLNDKRDAIQAVEKQYGIEIIITVDTHMLSGEFEVVKVTHDDKEVKHDPNNKKGSSKKRRSRGGRGRNKNRDKDTNDSNDETENKDSEETSDKEEPGEEKDKKPRRSRGRRGGRGRNRNRNRDRDNNEQDNSEGDNSSSDSESPAPEAEETTEKKKPQRRRSPKPKAEDGETKPAEPKAESKPVENAPANTASDLKAPKIETHETPEDKGEKKKGWWSRVIEG